MNLLPTDTWPQFYTATAADWRPIFEPDKYKDIIVNSLKFLVHNNRINLYGFVVMINHIHVIWQAISREPVNQQSGCGKSQHPLHKVQESFMKFTAQQIKFDLLENSPDILELYKAETIDRDYNFWQRRALGTELFTPYAFQQKLDYIHNNPVKAGLCSLPEAYYYSSASFYFSGVDPFDMITHY